MPKGRVQNSEERKLAAIMFTDIVGYTALTQSDERQALEILERHNKLLRPLFMKYRGREVKTIGDSFLVEFDSALNATLCAVEIQKFLHDYNISTSNSWKIKLRIGIHVGDVVYKHNDIFGDAVNIASRIQPLANPEGVCISEQVYAQVHNKISYSIEQIEDASLKNVSFATSVYSVVMPWDGEPTTELKLESKRIAVLPFVSMSPDPNDEYFADGLTEELIDRLCQVKELAVIARTSVMNYKKEKKNASQIGKELKVGALVEGSVRKAGNMIRVTAQLINSATEEHMWSSRYDRNLLDIFAVQTDIAENVTGALKIRLLEKDKEKISRVPTRDPEAHELYMKGRSLRSRQSEESFKAELSFYEKAISIDPYYVEPYRALAVVYWGLAIHEIIPTKEAYSKVQEYAKKVLELDSSSAESHLTKGLVLAMEMNFKGTREEFQRAVELNPNLYEPHEALALSYFTSRENGGLEVQRMLDLDPLSVNGLVSGATFYLYARDPDKALELYKKALSIDPDNGFVIGNIGLCHISKGMYDLGVTEVKRAKEMGMRHPNAMADIPYALAMAGRMEEAREVVNEMVKFYEEHGTGTVSVAKGYAAIGENDKVLQLLEKAYAEHAPQLIWAAVDFNLEMIKSDPRLQAFLRKLGLPSTLSF